MQIFADKIFQNPIKIIEAFDDKSFKEAFNLIENYRKKYYLLGYIRYEAKDIFLGKKISSKLPLLYFEVFENNGEFCSQNLPHQTNLSPKAQIDYKTYKKAIEKIKEEIAEGNTYQVNYTYDYKIKTEAEGFKFYNSILSNQKTPYNAYIKNKYEEILSFSPELFFTLEGNKIKTKPMKGTIQRGKTLKEDRKNIEFLKNDIKNRAENVMIVDLLRNDLGKIAKTGTVKVDKLFEIETHKTVHQMTSEISAELEKNTTLYDVFSAIYPCGSVTGAPKINTMKIIDELEIGSREIYCGAIGLISPEKTVFSVPIRILHKHNNENFYKCRVGGAIVWDSTAKDEWEETLTKIKFLRHCEEGQSPDVAIQKENFGLLHSVRNDIKLVETILIQNGKMKYKTLHMNRFKNSAKELGFKFNQNILKIKPKKNGILRILLSKEGVFETQYLPLDKIKTNKIIVSKTPVNSKETMLQHKTTHRPWYEKSLKKIKNGEIFDEIFLNEKEEITEGTRSNIILQIDSKLYTPPVKCGLLNGVMRQKMSNKLIEKKLYINDLKRAEKVFCINSIRGIVEVQNDSN